MSSTVEQIKERVSIVDVVSSYVKLEKAGKNFKAKCPFHNEKTPSFFISPDRNTYYCFGCGVKGDIFTFVEEFEGLDFMGALKILAARAGVAINQIDFSKKDPHTRLYEVLEATAVFFENLFERTTSPKEYSESRGITEGSRKQFRIGYAPDAWRDLSGHLSTKGFTEREMRDAGLIKQSEEAKEKTPYDVFRNRLIFPIFDSSGRVIGFSGRALATDEKGPKYLNSPETPVFKKGEVLLGLDRAKTAIRTYNFSILVEGQVDLVLAHQAGFTNTVAVMGSAFSQSHATRLHRLSGNMVIALDADDAGIAAAAKTSRMALAEGMDVKVATLPEGLDPADVIQKDKTIWKEAIKNATPVIEFFLARAVQKEADPRKLKKIVRSEVLPYVSLIPNKIDQAHFVGIIAKALRVDEAVVWEELPRVAFESPEIAHIEPQKEIVDATSRRNRLVRHLLGIGEWQKREATDSKVDVSALTTSLERILGPTYKDHLSQEDTESAAFEAEIAYAGSDILNTHIDEILLGLEEDVLKQQFTTLMNDLVDAERKGESKRAEEILQKCKEISAKLEALHKHM